MTGFGWSGIARTAMMEVSYATTNNGNRCTGNKNKFGLTQLTAKQIELAKTCQLPRVPEFREKLNKHFNIDIPSIEPEQLNKDSKIAFIFTRLYLECIFIRDKNDITNKNEQDIPNDTPRRRKLLAKHFFSDIIEGIARLEHASELIEIDEKNHNRVSI